MKTLLAKVFIFVLITICCLVIFWFFKVYDFKGEKLLIPRGYIGPVTIYYERIEGENIRRSNSGAIIYRIPRAGKLTVNFKDYIHRGTPLQNRKYFLYDDKEGNTLTEVKDYKESSTKGYFLVDFQYGPDSLDRTGSQLLFRILHSL